MPCSSRCIGAYGHLIRCDVQYNYQKELMISNDAQQRDGAGGKVVLCWVSIWLFKCRFRIFAFHLLIPNLHDLRLWNIKNLSCCIFVHTVRVNGLDSIDFHCMSKNSQNIFSMIFLYNAGGKTSHGRTSRVSRITVFICGWYLNINFYNTCINVYV